MGFAETRWSLVLRAGVETEKGREALNSLCHEYEAPLRDYLRNSGYNESIASDFLQSFFLKLLERRFLASVDPQKGRFRNFLIVALKRSVANDLRDARTLRRGGSANVVSLDSRTPSDKPIEVETHNLRPDTVFHRRWAIHLLQSAVDAVETKYRRAGKYAVFEALYPAIAWNSGSIDRTEVAELLGVTQNNLRVLVHRIRNDFRVAVRAEVLDTLSDPNDLDAELRDLAMALNPEIDL